MGTSSVRSAPILVLRGRRPATGSTERAQPPRPHAAVAAPGLSGQGDHRARLVLAGPPGRRGTPPTWGSTRRSRGRGWRPLPQRLVGLAELLVGPDVHGPWRPRTPEAPGARPLACPRRGRSTTKPAATWKAVTLGLVAGHRGPLTGTPAAPEVDGHAAEGDAHLAPNSSTLTRTGSPPGAGPDSLRDLDVVAHGGTLRAGHPVAARADRPKGAGGGAAQKRRHHRLMA